MHLFRSKILLTALFLCGTVNSNAQAQTVFSSRLPSPPTSPSTPTPVPSPNPPLDGLAYDGPPIYNTQTQDPDFATGPRLVDTKNISNTLRPSEDFYRPQDDPATKLVWSNTRSSSTIPNGGSGTSYSTTNYSGSVRTTVAGQLTSDRSGTSSGTVYGNGTSSRYSSQSVAIRFSQ